MYAFNSSAFLTRYKSLNSQVVILTRQDTRCHPLGTAYFTYSPMTLDKTILALAHM